MCARAKYFADQKKLKKKDKIVYRTISKDKSQKGQIQRYDQKQVNKKPSLDD